VRGDDAEVVASKSPVPSGTGLGSKTFNNITHQLAKLEDVAAAGALQGLSTVK